jgi:hypothetical protein
MRLWPESFLAPEDHDRFCPACDGTGAENVDGVAMECSRCDGVRRRALEWSEEIETLKADMRAALMRDEKEP